MYPPHTPKDSFKILGMFVGVILLLWVMANLQAEASAPVRTCFPAKHWAPAPDSIRPCVSVTHVYEDGSFSFRVTDADGTERYTAGVGALDR